MLGFVRIFLLSIGAYVSEKKGDLTAFLRIFKYVRPQWPRLVAVVAVVIIIAILYSLSFMTIGPLLKVMMGEEGLHGWVDRKLCNRRYGVDFYVPELVDFTEITDNQLSSYLQITLLDEAKSAFRAGLRVGDKVIGIGAEMPKNVRQGVPAARLLENLANAEQDLETSVLVRRESALGISEEHLLKLVPPAMEGLDAWVTSRVRSIMRFVPRGQTRATKRRAIILIIIVMAIFTVIRCLARFVQNYLVEAIVLTSMTQLREDCFAKVMHMPIRYFSVGGVSDTISRINGDTSATGAGVKIVLGKALREPMKAVGLLALPCISA